MEEKRPRMRGIIPLIGLIIVLILGVELMFMGVERLMPPRPELPEAQSSAVQQEAPRFCTHCGREMREGFQWGQFCPYCGQQVK